MAKAANDIKQTVLEFIRDLKDNVFSGKTEQGELALVEFFFTKMKSNAVADHIVSHILPHETAIQTRNVQFFVKEKNNIFGGLPKDRVEYFSNLVTLPPQHGGLSQDDKNAAWTYFDTLVDLAKLYRKNK